jgi:hypothetical protein
MVASIFSYFGNSVRSAKMYFYFLQNVIFIERCFSLFYFYFLEHNAFMLTAKCYFRLISNLFSLVSSMIKLKTGPPTNCAFIIIKTRVISLCHHAQTNTGMGWGAPHLLSIQQRERLADPNQ